ncbi:tRNA (guanosine(37)-N1)-methyltransferase TrmD [Patescibacteria group bacterium]
MIKINIITLFPDLISKHLEYLPFRKAIEKDLLEINLVDLKEYGLDNYGAVDGKPYGGGTGMILRVEPIYNALNDLKTLPKRKKGSKTILLSPKGEKYSQKMAEEYKELDEITIICGRYEGVDARVESFVDEIVSIGDYVLSGGELGALVIAESLTRLLPGVLDKKDAAKIESFSDGKLEFPQYTRPESFENLNVPEILLSGDHKKIQEWRDEQSKGVSESN